MKKANILVVDDDTDLADGMADVLDAKGYHVSVANNGFAALELVKKTSFDIVLMDIRMPGMNGVETYRRIKEVRPKIKAIVMTAYSVEDVVEEAIQERVYKVLNKPVDLDGLMALIEDIAGNLSVMVVDDDPAICEAIKDVLEERGYKVYTAGDYDEATLLACEEPIAIFLIDIKLPTRNGLETYLALREIDPTATAIMITGYRRETIDLAEKATASGAYACLYKPLDMADVEKCIDEALCAKHGGFQPRTGGEKYG
jgi:two-component system response regulator HydG